MAAQKRENFRIPTNSKKVGVGQEKDENERGMGGEKEIIFESIPSDSVGAHNLFAA